MALNPFSDEHFMNAALQEAQLALEKEEIPVGAVIVSKNRIIARGHNLCEHLCDVTAHAEMQAITAASNYLGGKYLRNCTLYVTLEPCVMCAGALFWSQIDRIVFGADDPKRGFRTVGNALLHPKTTVLGGIHAEVCSLLITDFFEMRRKDDE